MNQQEIYDATIYILKGIPVTLEYSIISFSIGITLAIALTFLRNLENKFLSRFVSAYVSIFRGTPLMLQLGTIFFGSHMAFETGLSVFQAGILSFSLNSAAYISEILRSGCNGLNQSQILNAKSLSIPKFYIIKDIILPQAIKNMLPALMNEFVDLIKESSIISTISGCDLMRRANIISAEYYSYFIPFLIVGIIYYTMVTIMLFIAHKIDYVINKKPAYKG